VIKYWWKRTTR